MFHVYWFDVSRAIKQSLKIRISNYLFKLKFRIVTSDIQFLALSKPFTPESEALLSYNHDVPVPCHTLVRIIKNTTVSQ